MGLRVEILDQGLGAGLQIVTERRRHEVFHDEIAVFRESLRHVRRETGLAAPEAPRFLRAVGQDRVPRLQAVPCFRGERPRWPAMVWPISAKLAWMPTECGFNPGPENSTGTCSRV